MTRYGETPRVHCSRAVLTKLTFTNWVLMASLAPLVLLPACATRLEVSPLLDAGAPTGAPYSLYFNQFEIAVQYELVECGPGLGLRVGAEVKANNPVADPQHQYVIDTASLAAFNKISEFEINYHPSGLASSINAEVEDRTAQIISGAVKAVGGIARLVAGAGAAGVSGGAGVQCTPETLQLIASRNTKKAELDQLTQAHERAMAEFERLKSRVDAAAPVIDEDLRHSFSRAYLSLLQATDRLEAAKSALERIKRQLTLEVTHLWPENGSELRRDVPFTEELFERALRRWTTNSIDEIDTDLGEQRRAFHTLSLVFEIQPRNPSRLTAVQGSGGTLPAADLERGLPYRQAEPGVLLVTAPVASDEVGEAGRSGEPKTLIRKNYSFLQFGRIFLLPCESAAFTSMSCSLAMNADGRLTAVGAGQSNAPGEAIVGVLGTVVGEATATAAAIRGRELARRQAELALLDTEVKIETAREALEDSEPEQIETLNEEIALLEAERRLIEARRALEEARALVED